MLRIYGSKLVKHCGKCGVELTSHGTDTELCRNCFRVQPKFCNTCGKELNRYTRSVQCRDCWSKRGGSPPRVCSSCGTSMKKYVNPIYDQCKACRALVIPHCIDCGKDLRKGSKSPRCWSCHTERRISAAAEKQCTIEGCTNKHAAKGLCAIHYERMRVTRSRGGRHIDSRSRIWVAQQPCQVCGYNRMRSHVHRFIPQGDYTAGNMVALCARCHDEIHRELTPCPQPLTPSLA